MKKCSKWIRIKRDFTIYLALVILIGIIPIQLSANTNESNCTCGDMIRVEGKFIDSPTLGTGAKWRLCQCGELVVGGGFIETVTSSISWFDSHWFAYYENINRIIFTAPIIAGNNSSSLFSNLSNVKSITGLEFFDTSNVTTMAYMFNYTIGLTALDVSGWDTSNVTDMSCMFIGASGLTSLDVSRWDTSKVTDMSQMFAGASGLTALDVSDWDTGNVTDMDNMFAGASGLTTLNPSGWDTSSVTNMRTLFYGASGLTTLDLSGWDTSNVTNMNNLFSHANGFTALNLSGWDTSKVTDMSVMFANSSGLKSLDLSGWDTSNATEMSAMFMGASGLTTLDLSGWVTSNDTNITGMFNATYALRKITFGKNFISDDYYGMPNVSPLNGNGWRTAGNPDILQSEALWEYLRTPRTSTETWEWALISETNTETITANAIAMLTKNILTNVAAFTVNALMSII